MSAKTVKVDGKSHSFDKFNLDQLPKSSVIGVIGKRGCGTSTLCRNILNEVSTPANIIISPTEEVNPFYKDTVPNSLIHYKYNNSILENLFRRQRKMRIKKGNIAKRDKSKSEKMDLRASIVMDQCLGSAKSWVRSEEMQKLFFNGRSYGLTSVLAMQYPMGIPPELRSNFDYVFLFADDSHENQKRVYQQYANMFPSVGAFRSVFDELTKDYGCMVISNVGNKRELCDKIFWFKADIKENTKATVKDSTDVDMLDLQFQKDVSTDTDDLQRYVDGEEIEEYKKEVSDDESEEEDNNNNNNDNNNNNSIFGWLSSWF